jgi:hypothetical protein
LSQNPSVTADELLPFVYATVQPSVGSQTIASVVEKEDLEKSDDDDETVKLITVKRKLQTRKIDNSSFEQKVRRRGCRRVAAIRPRLSQQQRAKQLWK